MFFNSPENNETRAFAQNQGWVGKIETRVEALGNKLARVKIYEDGLSKVPMEVFVVFA